MLLWVVVLSASLSGCADVISRWPRQLDLTPPPPPRSTLRDEAVAGRKNKRAKGTVKAKEVVHSAPITDIRETSSTPGAGLFASPANTGETMTLGDEDRSERRTKRLLNEIDTRLGAIKRAKLSSNDARVYGQAVSFETQARAAMQQHDHVAASGLLEKASVLADKVAASSPQR